MKKMIMMIIAASLIMPAVTDAQLSKSWDYGFTEYYPNTEGHFSFVNGDEPVLLVITENDFGVHKLNNDGTKDWYSEYVVGGRGYGIELAIGSSNTINFIGKPLYEFGLVKEVYSFSVSETGSLLTKKRLTASTYVSLTGSDISSMRLRMSSSGDVVSSTIPRWSYDCPVGENVNSYYTTTYAVNYYNAGNSSYAWEVGFDDGNNETTQSSVLGEFTADGSILVLEHYSDNSPCNCVLAGCQGVIQKTYIQKFNSSGSRLWRTQIPLKHGKILAQSEDYIIIRSSAKHPIESDYTTSTILINVVSIETGTILWSYQVSGGYNPHKAEIHNDVFLMQNKKGASTYLQHFDITTETLISSTLLDFSIVDKAGSKWIDSEGNVYFLSGNSKIISYDLNLNERWRKPVDAGTNSILGFDTFNHIYMIRKAGSSFVISKYTQEPSITFLDANSDTLSNKDFYLIRVANDAPLFTPDTLGIVKTDADGKIQLTPVP